MNIKILFVFCLTIFLKKVNCCQLDPKGKSVFCTSWDNIKNGDYAEYKSLYAYMVGSKHQVLDEEFFDSNLNHLEQIGIKGGNVTFKPGVLKGMTNLKNVDISSVENKCILKEGLFDNTVVQDISIHDSVTGIEPGSFDNMPNARQAWVLRNNIQIIKKGVFTKTNFKMIYFGYNKVQTIEDGAFYDMKNLKYIDLENNLLKTIDIEKIIGKSLTLDILIVDSNKLTKVPENLLNNAPNLGVFNISNNQIQDLQDGIFVNAEKLWLLDISINNIQEIPENVFSIDSNLTNLYIHSNDLQYLAPELLDKLTNLKEFSYTGNFWKCPCLHELDQWVAKKNIKNVCEIKVSSCDSESMEKTCDYHKMDLNGLGKTLPASSCHIEDWRRCLKRKEEEEAKDN